MISLDSDGPPSLDNASLILNDFVAGCTACGFRVIELSTDKKPKRSRRLKVGGQSILVSPGAPEGSDAISTLTAVYRFLDANNNSILTSKEFVILDGLWRELRQSMWEFVHIVVAKHCGSIEDAWDMIDVDKNGKISQEEFCDIVKLWGIDGRTEHIYSYLDRQGGGAVSKIEWLTLGDVPAVTKPT
eukprot:TRINITY_DN42204_c0_g1_i2.p1 TRINITY_DN42204_c0_g1~~TRINITY_DN42204_c0_g1_i2.p1  ORF type:complete len:187 (+),score=34.11 TRINITY_DN42204_c0_g1_i2:172-732(+)